jgi:hypothetical protein
MVTQEQNKALMRLINQEEVDHVVEEMAPRKVRGPNNFTTYFLHHCWDMIREEV